MGLLDPNRWSRSARVVVAGVAPAGVVTLGALLPVEVSTTTAALCYVLAVVVAAATGGLVPGLIASVCSFLALNFFFTPPFHTFAVEQRADLVALAVFIAVSVAVGTMLSRVLEQRVRAERRERDARCSITSARDCARAPRPQKCSVASPCRSPSIFDLARCEIISDLAEGPVVVEGSRGSMDGGREESIPLDRARADPGSDHRRDERHTARPEHRGSRRDPHPRFADRVGDRWDAARL